jgi:hypothetical protein
MNGNEARRLCDQALLCEAGMSAVNAHLPVKFSAMRQAIAAAYEVDELKQIRDQDCTGDFSWNNVKVGPVFRVVFVNHADEFRAISSVPGVIITATSGKKLDDVFGEIMRLDRADARE